MIDKEIINKHLLEIEKIVKNLNKYTKIPLDELESDIDKTWIIEHGLQLAIQNLIDIGGHILAAIGENDINDNTDIIIKLGKLNIIPQKFAAEIKGMAGFRNILVHEYIDVDIREIYKVLTKNLKDFISFEKYIKDYMQSLNSV